MRVPADINNKKNLCRYKNSKRIESRYKNIELLKIESFYVNRPTLVKGSSALVIKHFIYIIIEQFA